MASNKGILVVALLAAVAGAAASLYFEPTIALRLAGTEPGQRVLETVLDAKAPTPPAGTKIAKRGDIVPAMTLATPNGAKVEIPRDWAGKPTLVNLWASWCAPCRAELPAFAAAQQRSPELRFLFINQGEDAATVQRFVAAQPFALDGVWLDRGSRLGPAIGSTGLPTTLFVDASGRVVERHVGMLSAPSLAHRLRALR